MVNLFWLHPATILDKKLDYSQCAKEHIDAHVIKEATQILYTAHNLRPSKKNWNETAPKSNEGTNGYIRAVFVRNPITRWVQDHVFHYRHVVAYGLSLCEEYTYRFEKTHACQAHLEWLKLNEPNLETGNKNFRSPPCCMGQNYKIVANGKQEPVEQLGDSELDLIFDESVFKSYHNYYIGEKLVLKLSRYTRRDIPEWIFKHIESKPETFEVKKHEKKGQLVAYSIHSLVPVEKKQKKHKTKEKQKEKKSPKKPKTDKTEMDE